MRTFTKIAAQGDVMFIKTDGLPKGAIKVSAEKGRIVVAHSETGHNHSFADDGVTLYRLPDDIMNCFLVVDKPAVLEHHREFDTHEPIKFEKGTYQVRRQRENTPEGWRRVED